MPENKLINERPITMVEVASDLAKIEKEDKELNFRSNKASAYIKAFTKLDLKQVNELFKKIEELNIPRLKERQIVKAIDILPKDIDELRMVFIGETTTVSDENMNKLLDVVKEYVKKK
jgi:DNA-directed RNA polymerase subunit F